MKWSNLLIDPAAHYMPSTAQDWLSDNYSWCRSYAMKQTIHHTKKLWGCRLDNQLIHAAFISHTTILLILYSIQKHHLSCHFLTLSCKWLQVRVSTGSVMLPYFPLSKYHWKPAVHKHSLNAQAAAFECPLSTCWTIRHLYSAFSEPWIMLWGSFLKYWLNKSG